MNTSKKHQSSGSVQGNKVSVYISRLPSVLDGSESIGEDWKLGEHGREPFDEGQQPVFGRGGDEFVKHAALPEQRVGAPFGNV